MNRTFALAATLAAGIAMAPMAADAALRSVTPISPGVVLSVPSQGVFSPTSVGGVEVPPGAFTDRWYFDLDQNAIFSASVVDVALRDFFNITFNDPGEGVYLRSGDPFADVVGAGTLEETFSRTSVGDFDIFEALGVSLIPLTGDANAPNYYVEITGTAVLGGGNYDGSWAVVPVPAALPLMLTALAGLGLIGRRKMKAAA